MGSCGIIYPLTLSILTRNVNTRLRDTPQFLNLVLTEASLIYNLTGKISRRMTTRYTNTFNPYRKLFLSSSFPFRGQGVREHPALPTIKELESLSLGSNNLGQPNRHGKNICWCCCKTETDEQIIQFSHPRYRTVIVTPWPEHSNFLWLLGHLVRSIWGNILVQVWLRQTKLSPQGVPSITKSRWSRSGFSGFEVVVLKCYRK